MFLKIFSPIVVITTFLAVHCSAQHASHDTPKAVVSSKNIVSVAPVAINNRGLCFGATYERFLQDDERVSFYTPVLYNQGEPKQHYHDTYSQNNVSIYLGLKYYTSRKEASVRYALGAVVGDALSFRHVTYSQYLGGSYERNDHILIHGIGFMFHNSLNVNLSKHFTYSAEFNFGVGAQTKSNKIDNGDSDAPLAMMLQMGFGYRF